MVVEGNHYFPIGSAQRDVLAQTATHGVCPWESTASHSLTVGGRSSTEPMGYSTSTWSPGLTARAVVVEPTKAKR